MTGIVVASVNLWKEQPGDKRLIRYVRRKAKRKARRHDAKGVVLCMTEFGRGPRSVRVRPILKWTKRRASKQKWRRVTPFGAHNHIAVRNIRTPDGALRVACVHGLHKRTVGRVRQATYHATLAARVATWTLRGRRWVVAGDFNRGHRQIARLLGGKAHGKGVDGIIAGPGVGIRRLGIDHTGQRRRLTDHPIIYALVWIKR